MRKKVVVNVFLKILCLIGERIIMINGVKIAQFTMIYNGNRPRRLKKNCGPRAGTTQAVSIESVKFAWGSGRRSVGPLWRGVRLEAIGPIG